MAVWDPQFKNSGNGKWDPEYVGQPAPKPVEFAPGFNVGPPGSQGLPGISPTVEVEGINGGYRVKIEAVNGSFSFDLFDGEKGADGVSPSVNVSKITEGHRVTITDSRGTYSFDLYNGAQGLPGQDGAAGTPGKDGVSPSVSVSTIDNGHRVSITDANRVQTFDVMDGKRGDDGISPTITVTAVIGGHEVTTTDKEGTESFTVLDGEPGKPPAVSSNGNWQVWDGEKYVDTGYSATALHNDNGGGLVKMWFGSIEEYNALDTIYNDVAYHILEGAIPV